MPFKENGPIPSRIAALPRDARGYPVPYFVRVVDGVPDFRLADPNKLVRCIKRRLCWICGQPLGRVLVFVLGPMCTVSRTSSEPPAHYDCSRFAATHCPFLILPKATRRDANLPECKRDAPGVMLERNPGVCALWSTRSFHVWRAHSGAPGILITVGDPERVEWFAEGRAATGAEVRAGLAGGLDELRRIATEGGENMAEFEEKVTHARRYLPA